MIEVIPTTDVWSDMMEAFHLQGLEYDLIVPWGHYPVKAFPEDIVAECRLDRFDGTEGVVQIREIQELKISLDTKAADDELLLYAGYLPVEFKRLKQWPWCDLFDSSRDALVDWARRNAKHKKFCRCLILSVTRAGDLAPERAGRRDFVEDFWARRGGRK